MNSTAVCHLLIVLGALVAARTLRADEPSKSSATAVVALADLGLEHDGKEVTMIFKITDTQLIGGEREGKFPHVKLHYDGMEKAPYIVVYAKGELADALHRFACVAPDDRFVGRSIKASGNIKIYTNFPEDWRDSCQTE